MNRMTNKFQRSLDLKTLCLILKLLVIRLKLRNPEIGECNILDTYIYFVVVMIKNQYQ